MDPHWEVESMICMFVNPALLDLFMSPYIFLDHTRSTSCRWARGTLGKNAQAFGSASQLHRALGTQTSSLKAAVTRTIQMEAGNGVPYDSWKNKYRRKKNQCINFRSLKRTVIVYHHSFPSVMSFVRCNSKDTD